MYACVWVRVYQHTRYMSKTELKYQTENTPTQSPQSTKRDNDIKKGNCVQHMLTT